MNTENWQKVKEVFYSALNKPESDRAAYLDEVCSGEPAFRSEVEMLLNSYETSFLEDSLWPDRIDNEKPEKQFFTAGDEFSHYRIIKLIGRGGMGEVYLAEDKTLDRPVAIKIVSEGSGFGEMADKRLLREARSAARLDHPNICSVYEVGETEGRPFIAMQYVDGETLDARIKRGPIPFDECVLITRKIAAALAEAHAQGIVHRDIKPANIIIDARGQLKVLDFGLAKRSLMNEGTNESQLSEVGIIAGTAAFMSPEQARGQQVDPRTDIWSLGVVFYQMITGRVPFSGGSNADTVSAILNSDFAKPSSLEPSLPKIADQLVDRTLQKERDQRYLTVSQFDADLATIEINPTHSIGRLTGEISSHYKSSTTEIKLTNFRFRGLTSFFLILILLVAGIAFFAYRTRSSRPDSFSPATAGRLQLSTLFSSKRPPNGQIQSLSFSPDGKLIVFLLYDGGKSAIYVKQINGSEPIRITDGKWLDQTPVWAPDSQRLAFVSDRGDQTAIWTVSYLGGTPVLQLRLEKNQTEYQLRKWANDGTQIYFESKSPATLKSISLTSGEIKDIELRNVDGLVEGDFGIAGGDELIAFVSNEGKKTMLWYQDLETAKPAIRISDGNHDNFAPSWFPGNRRIAYLSDQNGNSQIYVRDLDSSESRQITFGDNNVSSPVVGPSGNQIAYASDIDEANIYSYDFRTKSESRATSDINLQLFPSISPSGTRMAYQKTTDVSELCTSQLKLTTLPGSGEITSLPTTGCNVKWSPLGREIAYLKAEGDDRNLWKLDVDSQIESRITSTGISEFGHNIAPYNFMLSSFEWSPDGTKIAFTSKNSGQHNIWTVQSDGTNPQQLTSYASGASAGLSPSWSSDNNRLAFLETNSTGPIAWSVENRILVIERDNIRSIAETHGKTRILGWTALNDGVYVAVEKADHIDILCAKYSSPLQIIGSFNGAHINGMVKSPDGRWIGYSARIAGIDNVYIVSTNGGSPRKLTANGDDALFYSGLNWSPDAKQLFYSKQTGGMQISLITDTN